MTDGMKCTRPWQVNFAFSENGRSDPLHPPSHFAGPAPSKRQQENSPRIHAVSDQMGNPVHEGFGLAGSSAGKDK